MTLEIHVSSDNIHQIHPTYGRGSVIRVNYLPHRSAMYVHTCLNYDPEIALEQAAHSQILEKPINGCHFAS